METNHIGQHVRTTKTFNRLERDERGNYLRTESGGYVCTPVPAGSYGVIVGKESHGANPWTRWSVDVHFAHGVAHLGGCTIGGDVELLTFDEVEALGLDGTLRS